MFFLWFAWPMLLFRIVREIFRSDDIGGWGMAGWSILVLIVPLLGALIYVIARGDSMAERDVAQARAAEASFRSYVQEAAGSGTGTAAELEKLAQPHSSGVLNDDEFARQKAKLLA